MLEIIFVDDETLRKSFVQAGFETVQEFSCDAEAQATSRLFAASLNIEPDVSTKAVKTTHSTKKTLLRTKTSPQQTPSLRG